MKKELLSTVFASLLILLFLYTSVNKYLAMQTFIDSMHKQPLPRFLIKSLIVALPPVEILVSVLLIFHKTRKIGFISSTVLMSAFTIYVVFGLMNLLQYTPCSCGGVIQGFTWTQHLYFNIFFLLVSILGLLIEAKFRVRNIMHRKLTHSAQ